MAVKADGAWRAQRLGYVRCMTNPSNDITTQEQDSLLATREVAEMLGMSREQVWRMFNTGRLPAYRFDRLLRFARSDVEQFMATHYQERPLTRGSITVATARTSRRQPLGYEPI